ncbi:MAG TPA: mannosyltransferase family protein [Aggregatilineaceae bacterium]|nr:mannosyltransferase family protein [Aggregatilineaceae bacterium]
MMNETSEHRAQPPAPLHNWLATRRANLRVLRSTSAFQIATKLWLGWVIIMILFQAAVWARLHVVGPDDAYGWTWEYSSTPPRVGLGLSHVRWDSYHYLRLAKMGYHGTQDAAFYPAYPVLMRYTALLFFKPVMPDVWAARDIEVFARAGFAVSIIASLAAVWSMFILYRDLLGSDDDAFRATFYSLIFPTAMFMTQVYTESLYLALATPALIFLLRRQWWACGVLTVLATLTRATGVLIVGAMALHWLLDWRAGKRPPWHTLIPMVLPVITWQIHVAMLAAIGLNMNVAQKNFGRVMFSPDNIQIVLNDIGYMITHEMGFVPIMEDIALPALALWGCWKARRRWPVLALYGVASLAVPFATGQLVSMNRYAVIVVPMYLALAIKGRNPMFDRLWTTISLLLLALYMVGFAHGYWSG